MIGHYFFCLLLIQYVVNLKFSFLSHDFSIECLCDRRRGGQGTELGPNPARSSYSCKNLISGSWAIINKTQKCINFFCFDDML